jgi:hypothetical protein
MFGFVEVAAGAASNGRTAKHPVTESQAGWDDFIELRSCLNLYRMRSVRGTGWVSTLWGAPSG